MPTYPWYLKRFFVDGHEYNVVAVLTELGPTGGARFKGITIRTPDPKPCDFVNFEDSLVLQGYFQGTQFGANTNLKSVMPPFNMDHSVIEDIVRRTPEQFAVDTGFQRRCTGDVLGNVGPLTISINAESVEPRFFGELKEQEAYRDPNTGLPLTSPTWGTEQFNTQPDHYTDLGFPAGQLYLLTSSWETRSGRLAYRACDTSTATGPFPIDTQDELATFVHPSQNTLPPFPQPTSVPVLVDPIPATNAVNTATNGQRYFDAALGLAPFVPNPLHTRVQFWYDPRDAGPGFAAAGADVGDIYVNLWTAGAVPPGGTATATPTATRTPTPTTTVAPGQPTSTPTATPPVTGQGALLSIVPVGTPFTKADSDVKVVTIGKTEDANITMTVGQKLQVNVEIQNAVQLFAVDLHVGFDSSKITIQDSDGNPLNGIQVTPGNMPDVPRLIAANLVNSLPNGDIAYAASRLGAGMSQNGSGTVFSFVLQAVAPTNGPVSQTVVQFNQIQMLREDASTSVPLAGTAKLNLTINESPTNGAAAGRVLAQGRATTNEGSSVELGSATTVTDAQGHYTLVNTQGTYNLTAARPKYLPSELSNVAIQANGISGLPIVSLRGGDATGDGKIDLFDLVIVAANYDSAPPSNAQADINDDGAVDVIDLVLVGSNYGISGVQQGLTLKTDDLHKNAVNVAQVAAEMPAQVKPGEMFQVPVRVRNVQGLFGAQVKVQYDPSKLTLVDMNEDVAGVQAEAGAAFANGYIGANKATLGKTGTYSFAATRLNPDKAIDGDTTLVTLTFVAKTNAKPTVTVSEARLLDTEANSLPAKIAGSK